MSVGYLEDILTQPENLARSHETFTEALRDADLSAFGAGPLVLAGMGSSYFAAMPASWALRAAGRPAFALSATELLEPGADLLGVAYVGPGVLAAAVAMDKLIFKRLLAFHGVPQVEFC